MVILCTEQCWWGIRWLDTIAFLNESLALNGDKITFLKIIKIFMQNKKAGDSTPALILL